jgi:hypothetical protein
VLLFFRLLLIARVASRIVVCSFVRSFPTAPARQTAASTLRPDQIAQFGVIWDELTGFGGEPGGGADAFVCATALHAHLTELGVKARRRAVVIYPSVSSFPPFLFLRLLFPT